MLLNNDADWNVRDKDGDTVLHFACMNSNQNGNYVGALKFLLSTPVKSLIDAQNSRGDTPLHVAIKYLNFCVQLIIVIKEEGGVSRRGW